MMMSRYKIVTGRWLVDGNPQVILFDVGSAASSLSLFKQELFDTAGIGAPHGDIEVNDVIIFGFMVAQFIADFRVRQQDSSQFMKDLARLYMIFTAAQGRKFRRPSSEDNGTFP